MNITLILIMVFVGIVLASKPKTVSNKNLSVTWRLVLKDQLPCSKAPCPTWPQTANPSKPVTSPTKTDTNRTELTSRLHHQSQLKSKNPSDFWLPSQAPQNQSTSKNLAPVTVTWHNVTYRNAWDSVVAVLLFLLPLRLTTAILHPTQQFPVFSSTVLSYPIVMLSSRSVYRIFQYLYFCLVL